MCFTWLHVLLQGYLQTNPQELKAEMVIHLLPAMLPLLSGAKEYEIHFCMAPEKDKTFLI